MDRLVSEKEYAQSLISEENTTTEESFTQAQTPVTYNLPVSVALRKKFNIPKSTNERLSISSCIKIYNTLIFTDNLWRRLIICNSDGIDIHHIPLSYQPQYMTKIDSNTVAVSCSERIKDILIINISTRSVISTINTSGICGGISYNDNNLYAVIDYSKIHVMDLTGKVTRTISAHSGLIRDITVDRDRLVYIDYTSLSIYCCSLDGELIWKFKKDESQDVRRVITDDEGNVYVTDYNANNVVVISDDGKLSKEIITESDGLEKPWGIYFDKKENSLLVVCNDHDFFLFDVKKNKNKPE